MSLLSLLLVAFGLSMDAFAVSITNGIAIKNLKTKHALKIALFMGGFQGIMPLIGWAAGFKFKDYITSIDHWIALILLSIIGGKMIFDAIKEKNAGEIIEETKNEDLLKNKVLLILAIATSIDALAVGVSFAFLDVSIIKSSIIIALTTFILSFIGVKIGKKCGALLKSKAEIVGGIVLILIGLKIFLEHMNIF